ncbi:MAG: YihY/virulence factor BrkB family protein [Clostridiales bacterium]|jgi:membrane protein|nr:YihY/virulence factor BrkB family protein [Clostridiales bacterium]
MKNFFILLLNLCIKCKRGQIAERAAGLTLSVLLAFFPFLVFLMSLMGFLNLNTDEILSGLYYALPGDDITSLVSYFVTQRSETRSAGLLSATLAFCLFNTSNGFRAVIRYTNMAYDVHEQRGFFAQVGLSFTLMLLFSAALIIMLGLLVFGRQLWSYIFPFGPEFFFTAISAITALIVLFIFTSYIYKSACAKSIPLKHIFPGAAFTVFSWVIVSAVFGFIMQHFTHFPAIYGSIAGVFILTIWLNCVAIVLLIGSEINALLYESGKIF